MATLEDRILGEKTHYYCSSSEDEDSGGQVAAAADTARAPACAPASPRIGGLTRTGSTNTGPKGVLADWSRHKQLQAEQRAEQQSELAALTKKLSLTCRSALNDQEEKERHKRVEDEINSLCVDEEFIREYTRKRMAELRATLSNPTVRFGTVLELKSADAMLEAIDQEDQRVTVVIHLYSTRVNSCDLLNQALNSLCQQYPTVKFCKIESAVAGVSVKFSLKGLPALLVYRGGALVANLVQLEEQLGVDFCSNDVDNLLLEHGLVETSSVAVESPSDQDSATT